MTTKKSTVLYVDHSGHPAPLSLTYHATASRSLSSSVPRYPPSTITEIDTAYCPQCLGFYSADSVNATETSTQQPPPAETKGGKGKCHRPTCRLCPICKSILSVVLEPGGGEGEDFPMVCLYKCGYCRWTSLECDVSLTLDQEEEMKNAAEDLALVLEKRMGDVEKSDDVFRLLVEGWGKQAQEEERRKRQEEGISMSRKSRRMDPKIENWSIDTLETSLQRKKNDTERNSISSIDIPSLKDENKLIEKLSISLPAPTPQQTVMQGVLNPVVPCSVSDLLPLYVPLRAKNSRRCRAELAAGRPGILVKPKVHPLEGDSSLRDGQGKWWKKDSSAIHVVPKIQVVQSGHFDESDSTYHVLLLKIKNPSLGIVCLRLNGSQKVTEIATINNDGICTLNDVLIDHMARKYVNARVIRITSSLPPTDMIELHPVEETFLEIGKVKNKDPSNVENWDAESTFRDCMSSGGLEGTTCKVISQQDDSAWMELIVKDDVGKEMMTKSLATTTGDDYFAAPLALQIEVGEGSWECSFIKPISVGEGERDFVTLDIVVVWAV